jgi:deazaflavin-dependent oxidoreductase (nitroreductase family)
MVTAGPSVAGPQGPATPPFARRMTQTPSGESHRSSERWTNSPLRSLRDRGRAEPWVVWKVNALLLTTRGRRSGRERTVVLQFFPDGDAMIVAAANDGGDAYPGWYLNLTASSDARVEVKGRTIVVRAEELPVDEAATWMRLVPATSP